jgi:Cu(I)-responsive transcriptional regulator
VQYHRERADAKPSEAGKVVQMEQAGMNIGEVAKDSGVSAKMIRYYESIGLVPAAGRRESGYRQYSDMDVHRLRFVRRARDLGFSIARIKELLALWSDTRRSDARVRVVAQGHVEELEQQARELQEVISVLKHLIRACAKGDRPHCPIIRELGNGSKATKSERMAANSHPPGQPKRPH